MRVKTGTTIQSNSSEANFVGDKTNESDINNNGFQKMKGVISRDRADPQR